MSENACHPDMVQFWTCLTRNVCMGSTLLTALQSAHEESKSDWVRKLIADVTVDIRKGLQLSEAMAKHPEAFSKAAVCFVQGGDYAGILDRVLVLILESMWRCPTCGCWNMPKPEPQSS